MVVFYLVEKLRGFLILFVLKLNLFFMIISIVLCDRVGGRDGNWKNGYRIKFMIINFG